MISPRDAFLEVAQTALRLVPWPTEPGLRIVGSPGPESPVLVTCNYALTVRRLLRALEGTDVWVVVAPSAGINVWCAASGGHFTTHQVVTALKTSGVEERVRHRRAILPQLSATGVRSRNLTRRCGWKARFGPVRAADLRSYLAAGEKKTDDMRRVRFEAIERLEMATAWAAPCAALVGGGAFLLDPGWALPAAAIAAALALFVFFAYDRIPGPRQALLAVAAAAGCAGITALSGGAGGAVLAAAATGALLSVVLTFDYDGSTPTQGGSHFEERRWRIALDRDLCKGVLSCVEVCPEACYERPPEGVRVVVHAHDERCIRCGACVVQCPQDALAFVDDSGVRIPPEQIRRFKLNLLGQRSVGVADPPAEA